MKSKKLINNKKHYIYFDILRVIACLFVVFNHSNERGFYKFINPNGSFAFHIFCSSLCKIAVPMFFIISGALLLKKEETIPQTFKRAIKFICDLIIFSFIYYFIDAKISGNSFSVKSTLGLIISSDYWHLWYLNYYIVFLVTLPFLRKFVKSLDLKTSLYLLFLAFVVMGILPIVSYYVTPINSYYTNLWINNRIFLYPIAGYILENIVDINNIKNKHICFLWLGFLIFMVITGISEYNFLLKSPGNKSEAFIKLFDLYNCCTIFLTIKYICTKIKFKEWCSKIIIEISKCTFGVYLLHIIFLWKIPTLYDFFIKVESGPIGGKIGIFVSCIIVFIISGVVTYILRKIPVVKKLF